MPSLDRHERRLMHLEAEVKELRSLWIENEGDIIEQKVRLDEHLREQPMTKQIYADGLVVAPGKAITDEVVYAELVPATPLIVWQGFGRKGWRRWVPFSTGRTWKEPHIRWWYEILTYKCKHDRR